MYGKKLHIIIAILICMLILPTALGEEVKPVKSIKIKQQSVTIPYGSTYAPEITITPEDATNKKLDWISTDESVCTVNANNELIAGKPGSAEITFTTADGSKKSAKIKVTVPVFDEAEQEITIESPDEFVIPIDLHGFSLDDIDYKPSGDKQFLSYIEKDGIHVFPVAAGKGSITLTNKKNSKDKQKITVIIAEAAVDTTTPRAIVVLDKRKVNPGDKVQAKYVVFGLSKKLTVSKIEWMYDYNGWIKDVKGLSGTATINAPKDGETKVVATVKFVDENGIAVQATSNKAIVDHLELVAMKEAIVIQKMEPMSLKYSIIGGSGKYQIEYNMFVVDSATRIQSKADSGKLKGERDFQIEPVFTYGDYGFASVEVTDTKNKKFKQVLKTKAGLEPVITDDWYAYVECETVEMIEEVPFRVYLTTNNIDKLKELRFGWSTYDADKNFRGVEATIQEEDGKYYTEIIPEQDMYSVCFYAVSHRGPNGEEPEYMICSHVCERIVQHK